MWLPPCDRTTIHPGSLHLRLLFAIMPSVGKWCTVTVVDGDGRRYSFDVNADSSYDAAHLYLTHVRANPSCGFPIPTTATLFEVVTGGQIHHVNGVRLKKWIENRRQEWKGPRGLLFSQRPMIGE